MPRPRHPLKTWLIQNGYDCDYQRLAAQLPSKPTSESVRQVANGYRLPSWDLAFEIEAVTQISAHDLRDEKFYPREAA